MVGLQLISTVPDTYPNSIKVFVGKCECDEFNFFWITHFATTHSIAKNTKPQAKPAPNECIANWYFS